MSDRDRAAVPVDDLGVDVPRLDAGDRLGGEGLVELDGGDVGPADPCTFQGEVGGLDRREAEQVGLVRGRAASGDPGHRLTRVGRSAAEEHRGGAVVEW